MKDLFLLDLDDTLLDFGRAEEANLKKTLTAFGITAGREFTERFHSINDALWKALERGELDRETLKVLRFEKSFEEFRIAADPRAVARAYFDGFGEVCFPFEGALGFLAALKERGRIFIVTNGSKCIQEAHLQAAGFLPYIERTFISEEIGANKPSLEFSRFVAQNIEGFSAEHAVWIGDSLTSDGKSAAIMGVDFILFAPHGAVPDDHGVVAQTYRELLSLLN